jgi:hypothetical protein
MAGRIRPMRLENVLRDVQSDRASLSHGRFLKWLVDTPLWHVEAVEGVHPVIVSWWATRRMEVASDP